MSQQSRFFTNLRALLLRFLALIQNPRRFAPVIIDCLLLIQSTWNERQLGPDLVYPMLGIKKRQSERLARLILEHSRAQRFFEIQAVPTYPQGIDPPCVAVTDLDQVPHNIVENCYSTQANFYGVVCTLMLSEIIVTLILHTTSQWSEGLQGLGLANWGLCIYFSLVFCLHAVCYGEGTLTLTRRPDSSAPGCAVLLDQDFALILNGSQSIVRAIAESNFNLTYHSMVESILFADEKKLLRDSFCDTLGDLCEGTCLAALMLYWFLFRPSTARVLVTASVVFHIVALLSISRPLQRLSSPGFSPSTWLMIKRFYSQAFPPVCIFLWYLRHLGGTTPVSDLGWHLWIFLMYSFLLSLLSPGYKTRSYPISSATFLDALGHPPVRKWQFNTLAAAATFHCLVLCHGITRPVGRHIDVLAFLDMLIPDETDVWRAWKARVADRIVHEEDIFFAPTIPTFRDERQQKDLVDLLDQAQSGYEKYRDVYALGAPPGSRTADDAARDDLRLGFGSASLLPRS